MINWKVRVKNKTFWIALIPAVLLVVQSVASLFGLEFDFTILSEKMTAVVNSVFALLTIIGIVHDPTTKGFGDSERAMTYEEPN